jgi:hypothetical protein
MVAPRPSLLYMGDSTSKDVKIAGWRNLWPRSFSPIQPSFFVECKAGDQLILPWVQRE